MKKVFKYIVGSILLSILLLACPSDVQKVYADGTDGYVEVIIENNSLSESDGAAWTGILIDEKIKVSNTITMYDAIKDALEKNNKDTSGISTGYVLSIEGLGVQEGGKEWLGTLNNWFVNGQYNKIEVENGDIVRIVYTCTGGVDEGSLNQSRDTSLAGIKCEKGQLSPTFSGSEKEYLLDLPDGTEEINIQPEAVNKNYQVRIYKGKNPDRSLKGFKLTEKISVKAGDILTVISGDPEWPSLSEKSEASVYIIKIGINGSFNSVPTAPGEGCEEDLLVNSEYSLNLTQIFSDADDEDVLTYYVSVNDGPFEGIESDFTYTPKASGIHVLKFKANDSKADSDIYQVLLNVDDGEERTISVAESENGEVTSDLEKAKKNDIVNITVTPVAGYALKELIITDKAGNNIKFELPDQMKSVYTFKMPSEEVNVTAVFDEACLVKILGGVEMNKFNAIKVFDDKSNEIPLKKKSITPRNPHEFQVVSGHYRYSIYDTKGKVVKNGDVNVDSGEKEKNIFLKKYWFNIYYTYDVKNEYKHGGYINIVDKGGKKVEFCDGASVASDGGGYQSLYYILEMGEGYEYSYTTTMVDKNVDASSCIGTLSCPINASDAKSSAKQIAIRPTSVKSQMTFKISKGSNPKLYYHPNVAYGALDEIEWDQEPETIGDYDIYTINLPVAPKTLMLIAGGEETEYKKEVMIFSAAKEDKEIILDLESFGEESDKPKLGMIMANDLYTNIGNGGYTTMNVGDSKRIEGFRVAQAVSDSITNAFVDPDMHYEVIWGNDCIALADAGKAGRLYKEMTAKKEGIAVIKITYDDMISNDRYCEAIDPANTGIIIVNIGGDSGDIQSGIDLTDYDTVYFTHKTNMPDGTVQLGNDSTTYTFHPDSDSNIVSVRTRDPIHDGREWDDTDAWTVYNAGEDGSYTIDLKNGRNIIEIVNGNGNVFYDTINAKEVDVTIDNTTHPGSLPTAGDTVDISFKGLELPIYKMAGIYNPGFPDTTWVKYKLNNTDEEVRSLGVQYSIHQINTISVKLNKAGNCILSGGKIHCEHLGSALDSHLDIPLSGVAPNMSAGSGSNNPDFGIMPDITIQVSGAEERVIALINKIDPDNYLAYINEIRAAQKAYDALDSASKKKVTNYKTLEIVYAKAKNVIEVVEAIEALPDKATLDNMETIYAVNMKFKALDKKERDAVTNANKLTLLVASLDDQKESKERIENVISLIDKLPSLDKLTADVSVMNAITEAQAAYNALSAEEQKQITNISKLNELQQQLPNLKAAQIVTDKIAAIGEVTELNCASKKDVILAARSAYENLNAAQKLLVTNFELLEQAEYNYSYFQVDTDVRQAMAVIRELYETTDGAGNKAPGPLAQTESNGKAIWGIWESWKDYVVNARKLVDSLAQEQQAKVDNLNDLKLAESYISNLEVEDVMQMLANLPDASTVSEYIAEQPVQASAEGAEIVTIDGEITETEETAEEVVGAQNRMLTESELKAIAAAMNAYNNLSDEQKKSIAADKVSNLMKLDEIAQTYEGYGKEFLQKYVDELAACYLKYKGTALSEFETPAVQSVVDKYDTYTAESQNSLNVMRATADTGLTFAQMREELQKQIARAEEEKEAAASISEWILSLPTKVTASNYAELEKDIAAIEAEYAKLSDVGKSYVKNMDQLNALKKVVAEVRKEVEAFKASKLSITAKATAYSSVTVSWDEDQDASSYLVYRKNGNSGWKKIASVGTLSYIDETVSGGTTYYYTVRAVSTKWGGSVVGDYGRSGVKVTTPFGGAANLNSTKSAGYNSVKLTWSKIDGAAGYRIYRAASKNGKYTKIKTISSRNTTVYTDTKLTAGKTYYYKMRAYRMSGSKCIWASYSSVKSAKPVPATVNLTRVTAGSKKAALTWKKVSGASGYVVYRAASQNGKYTRVASVKSNKLTYSDNKLKSRKAYYYKVRAYTTVKDGNVYGSASAAKGVKTK